MTLVRYYDKLGLLLIILCDTISHKKNKYKITQKHVLRNFIPLLKYVLYWSMYQLCYSTYQCLCSHVLSAEHLLLNKICSQQGQHTYIHSYGRGIAVVQCLWSCDTHVMWGCQQNHISKMGNFTLLLLVLFYTVPSLKTTYTLGNLAASVIQTKST